MGRIGFSIILGFLSIFVFFIGAESFEASQGTGTVAILSGCVAGALYLAICQFSMARKMAKGFSGMLPILLAMDAPLLVLCLIIAAVENSDVVLTQAIPMFFSGIIGSLVGAALGSWRPVDAQRLQTGKR